MLQPLIDSLFVGPVWPATVLLLLVLVYLVIAFTTACDLDFDGLDLDADGWQSVGALSLRWLHLDSVPIILWLALFACIQWPVAYYLWHELDAARHEPTWFMTAVLASRNAVIAMVATRFVLHPFIPYFRMGSAYEPEELIGQSVTIVSQLTTAAYGQARYETGGAPLLLNVRTHGPDLPKGSIVQIVDYQSDKRLYFVALSPVDPSASSSAS